MIKRCVYCNVELEENSVVDICQTCMYKVWGPKMSQAIISGMEKEKAKGNMELGRVGESGVEIEKVRDGFAESVVGVIESTGEIRIDEQMSEEQVPEVKENIGSPFFREDISF